MTAAIRFDFIIKYKCSALFIKILVFISVSVECIKFASYMWNIAL